MARSGLVRLVLVAALAVAVPSARAQTAVGVALDGVEGTAVFNALARECYEAGMVSDMPSGSIMDCTAVIEERSASEPAGEPDEADTSVVVRQKIRFALLERAGEGRISADAWTEIEELGTAVEQPIASEEYERRVQGVLTAIVARLRAGEPPPWTGRYENEQAWHLDAHLRAVSHCDRDLASLTAAAAAAQLESIGLQPTSDDLRDRCEQLYAQVFEWGLARGDAQPTVDKYLRYRAALPPAQRLCSGQLALEASCPR